MKLRVRRGLVLVLAVSLIALACASPPSIRPSNARAVDVHAESGDRFVAQVPAAAPPLDGGGCIRVLAIDGGGMRGIIPALVVAEIERRTGRPAAQLFDLIVGTSTGALLALGLSTGQAAHSAREIADFYEHEGAAIFSTGFATMVSLGGFLGPKYSPRGLKQALGRHFGDARINEARTLVEIPAYEIEDRKHFFFRSDVHSFFLRDVARAATAAPAYFPPVTLPVDRRVNGKGYVALIDGGVFANNPAPYALAAASRVRPASSDVLLVSLGTGAVPLPMPYAQASTWGLLQWARPLITMLFTDHGVDEAFRHVVPPGRYFRFQADPGAVRSPLDDASANNIRVLKRQAEMLVETRADEFTDLARRLQVARPTGCAPRRATRTSS